MNFNESQKEEISVEGDGLQNLFSKIPTTGGTKDEKDDDDKGGQKSAEELAAEEAAAEAQQAEAAEAARLAALEDKGEENEDKNKSKDGDFNYGDLIQSVVDDSGLDLGDIEVDASPEGLQTTIKALLEKKEKEVKENTIGELEETYPGIQNLLEHLDSGASITSFQRQQELLSFSQTELEEDNEELNEQVYRAYLNMKEITGDEQEELVENAKDTNKLFDKAVQSKSKLVEVEEKYIKAEKDREIEEVKAAKQQAEKVQKEVKTILEKSTLLGYKLDKEQTTLLSEAIYKVDAKGKSARDKAWENITTEQLMLIDFLLLNEFKPLGIKPVKNEKSIIIKGRAEKEAGKDKPDFSSKSGASGAGKVKIRSIRDLGINKQE